jgi:hypothetical protein
MFVSCMRSTADVTISLVQQELLWLELKYSELSLSCFWQHATYPFVLVGSELSTDFSEIGHHWGLGLSERPHQGNIVSVCSCCLQMVCGHDPCLCLWARVIEGVMPFLV